MALAQQRRDRFGDAAGIAGLFDGDRDRLQVARFQHRLARGQRHEHRFVHVRVGRPEISADRKALPADRDALADRIKSLAEQFARRRRGPSPRHRRIR